MLLPAKFRYFKAELQEMENGNARAPRINLQELLIMLLHGGTILLSPGKF